MPVNINQASVHLRQSNLYPSCKSSHQKQDRPPFKFFSKHFATASPDMRFCSVIKCPSCTAKELKGRFFKNFAPRFLASISVSKDSNRFFPLRISSVSVKPVIVLPDIKITGIIIINADVPRKTNAQIKTIFLIQLLCFSNIFIFYAKQTNYFTLFFKT